MYRTIIKAFLIVVIFTSLQLKGQDCECTLMEVENSTVSPCQLVIGEIINVATTAELKAAIKQANDEGGNKTILIADGTYQIATTASYPYITASNIVFRSQSGNRDAVILTGTGMKDVSPDVENVIFCVGNNITIADLTIKDVGNHGIATQGDNMFVHNVKIQNTFEQMLKGTSAGDGSDNSIVQCCLFEYPAGVGPQFYIGGLDIHEGSNWIVRDNIFKNIASPSASIAEHAIHFWDFSSDNTIERNWIINCDRGIGFGLGASPNDGGIIRNNMIYNNGNGLFNDVGIGLESSPNTKVYNNNIYVDYQNAIEFRFTETTNVDIINNLTNKRIQSRNGGEATLTTNYENAEESWFTDIETGNLRIPSEIMEVTDQGTPLEDVIKDCDKVLRPQGQSYDIGATEYEPTINNTKNKITTSTIRLYPNPIIESFTIKSDIHFNSDIKIYNLINQEVASYKNYNLTSGVLIETSKWVPGIYFCHISSLDKSTEVFKVIISGH